MYTLIVSRKEFNGVGKATTMPDGRFTVRLERGNVELLFTHVGQVEQVDGVEYEAIPALPEELRETHEA